MMLSWRGALHGLDVEGLMAVHLRPVRWSKSEFAYVATALKSCQVVRECWLVILVRKGTS